MKLGARKSGLSVCLMTAPLNFFVHEDIKMISTYLVL